MGNKSMTKKISTDAKNKHPIVDGVYLEKGEKNINKAVVKVLRITKSGQALCRQRNGITAIHKISGWQERFVYLPWKCSEGTATSYLPYDFELCLGVKFIDELKAWVTQHVKDRTQVLRAINKLESNDMAMKKANTSAGEIRGLKWQIVCVDEIDVV